MWYHSSWGFIPSYPVPEQLLCSLLRYLAFLLLAEGATPCPLTHLLLCQCTIPLSLECRRRDRAERSAHSFTMNRQGQLLEIPYRSASPCAGGGQGAARRPTGQLWRQRWQTQTMPQLLPSPYVLLKQKPAGGDTLCTGNSQEGRQKCCLLADISTDGSSWVLEHVAKVTRT